MEHVHLIGTEQVQSAANTMREASYEMRRAANTIHEAFRIHNLMMQDFMEALQNHENAQTK